MVDGGILIKVTAYNPRTGIAKHSRQLAYVSRHVTVPYLSLSACIDLGMVPATFPEVGSIDNDNNPNNYHYNNYRYNNSTSCKHNNNTDKIAFKHGSTECRAFIRRKGGMTVSNAMARQQSDNGP